MHRTRPARIKKPKAKRDTILWIEAFGFSVIILLAWVAELLRVPQLFFFDAWTVNWSRPILKTVVILLVWACVHVATKRLLRRLHHLEEFLLLCGWCRKIGHEGKWMSIEEYFGSAFATETSHGMCPECAKRLLDDMDETPARAVPQARVVAKRPPVSPPEA